MGMVPLYQSEVYEGHPYGGAVLFVLGSLDFTVLGLPFNMEPLRSEAWWQTLRSTGGGPLKGLWDPGLSASLCPTLTPQTFCHCVFSWHHPPSGAKQAGLRDLEYTLASLYCLYKQPASGMSFKLQKMDGYRQVSKVLGHFLLYQNNITHCNETVPSVIHSVSHTGISSR